mgnify:CR=1 FL=1
MEQKQEAIDVQAIIDLIWGKRMFIFKVSAVFFAVALVYVLSVPRTYTSHVTLAPELTNSSLGSSIGAIAEMAGLGLENTSGDAIYPEIYPQFISSNKFLVSLLDVKVCSLDKEIDTDLYQYYLKKQKKAWWIYPIGWVRKFVNLFKNKKKTQGGGSTIDPFHLTKEQFGICAQVNKAIKCMVDKKTGVISLSYTAQDPLIAATMVEVVKDKLQEHIVEYRTCKVRNDLVYFEALCNDTRKMFIEAQERYASFADKHNGAKLQSVAIQAERLENEVQLAQMAYSQASQQMQFTRAKLQENTPAFAVLSCASVPLKPSAPRRMFIVVAFVMMGAIGGAAYVYLKEQIQNSKK